MISGFIWIGNLKYHLCLFFADEHPGINSSIPQSQRSAAEAVAYKSL